MQQRQEAKINGTAYVYSLIFIIEKLLLTDRVQLLPLSSELMLDQF
ncbi:hypothetical protein NSQ61_00090 [Aeribacillus sp. FSL K6-1121]|nr:hypothetical protein [Aeribacillus pallidus]